MSVFLLYRSSFAIVPEYGLLVRYHILFQNEIFIHKKFSELIYFVQKLHTVLVFVDFLAQNFSPPHIKNKITKLFSVQML
jgi:hypothetical protein